MESIKNIIGIIFLLLVVALLLGGSIFLSLAASAALIVPLTYIWGLITGQSYDRVCDNSEIVYRVNQWGKWVWVFIVGFFLIWLIF